jgi:PadR family transcriptional regulator, regulatory protein AphA
MALANKTKYALLGALSIKAMSGYDIKKFSDLSISHFWNENYARIYPVLKEMEGESLVTKTTTHTEGRPDRNVYTITKKGLKELDEWLLQPIDDRPPREELLLKLFFSSNVPVENLIEKVKAEKEKQKKLIAEYERIEGVITTNKKISSMKGLPLWMATVSYGKHHSEGVIKWCNETLKSLEKSERKSERNKKSITRRIKR